MKDLNEWIEQGHKMAENRQKRIQRAKIWKFDTVATHGLYDLNQALEYNNGSIMEPVYMSPAQAYADSAEMEAAMSYQIPTWGYSRIANPSTFFLEETMALLETYGSDIQAPPWQPAAACRPYARLLILFYAMMRVSPIKILSFPPRSMAALFNSSGCEDGRRRGLKCAGL
jgi:hypothetical protein